MLFPKKLPDMPKGNWKSGLAFSPKIAPKKEKEVKVKVQKPLKRTPLPPPTKPIAQIGARKKARISEYGTESAHFVRIWAKRVASHDIWCEVCGEEVKTPVIGDKLVKPQCFAHKLAKGMYEKFRYLEENIGIVCSIKCHHAQDELLNDPIIRKNLEDEFNQILLNNNS